MPNDIEIKVKVSTQGLKALQDIADVLSKIQTASANAVKPFQTLTSAFQANTTAVTAQTGVLNNLSGALNTAAAAAQKKAAAQGGLGNSVRTTNGVLSQQQLAFRLLSADLSKLTGGPLDGVIQKFFALSSVMSNSGQLLSSFKGVMSEFASGLGTAGGAAIAAGLGIGALLTGAFKLASGLAADSIEIQNFSARTGIATTQAQELQKAFERAGVSGSALEGSAKKLAEALADNGAQGKLASKQLHDLGVSAYEFDGSARPVNETLVDLFKALSAIQNPSTRNAEGFKVLGRGFREIIPAVEEYQRQLLKVKETGAFLSPEDIKAGKEFHEVLFDLGQQWEKLLNVAKRGVVFTYKLVNNGEVSAGGLLGLALAANPITAPFIAGQAAGSVAGAVKTLFQSQDPLLSPGALAPSGSGANQPGIEQNNSINEALRRRAGISGRPDKLNGLQFDLNKVEGEIKEQELKLKDNVGPDANAAVATTLNGLIARRNGIAQAIDGAKKYAEDVKHVKTITLEADRLLRTDELDRNEDARTDTLKERSPALAGDINKAFDTKRQGIINKRDKTLALATARLSSSVQVDSLRAQSSELEHNTLIGNRGEDDPVAAQKAITDVLQKRLAISQQIFEVEYKTAQAERNDGTLNRQEFSAAAGKAAVDFAKNNINERKRAEEDIEALKERGRVRAENFQKGIAGINFDLNKGLAEQGAQKAGQFANFRFEGAGNEGNRIKESLAIRTGLTTQLAQIELKDINDRLSGDEKKIATAKLLKEITLETGKSDLEYQAQILELQQKRREEAKALGGEIYQAIRGGPKGIRSFFTGQADKLGGGVFSNALQEPLKNGLASASNLIGGQRDEKGNLTTVGKLFQGTILGSRSDANLPMITAQMRTTDAVTVGNQTLSDIKAILSNGLGVDASGSPVVTANGAGGGTGLPQLSSATASIIGQLSPGSAREVQAALSLASPLAKASGLFGAGSTASGLTSGLFAGLTGQGNLLKAFTGEDYSIKTADGRATTASAQGLTSGAARVGQIAGTSAAAALGVIETIKQFKNGGASGIIGGIGSAAGTAALLDPEPISKAILASIAGGAALVKTFLGDPKANRANAINTALTQGQYIAPPSVNLTTDQFGHNAIGGKNGVDTFGGIGYSVTDPSSHRFNGVYNNFPGYVTPNYTPNNTFGPSAAPGGNTTNVNLRIEALDTQNILDRSPDIAAAALKEMKLGGPIAQQIQQTVLGS